MLGYIHLTRVVVVAYKILQKPTIYETFITIVLRTAKRSPKRRRKPTLFNYHHGIPMNKSGMGRIYIGDERLNADVEALLLVIA